MTTRRDLKGKIAELEDAEEAGVGEWTDVERWRAFITGKNPRTGEPISDERRAEHRRALAKFADQEDES